MRAGWDRARAAAPLLNRLVRVVRHYSDVNGSLLAGALTFNAFFAFFPLAAVGFAVVGIVASTVPQARTGLGQALEQAFPGVIGSGTAQISLDTLQSASTAVGVIGFLGLLYTGLGWISAMQTVLATVFEVPKADRPNVVRGYLRDLATLILIGVVLLLAVGTATALTGFSRHLALALGLERGLGPVLTTLGVVVGAVAEVVLFYAIVRVLARPRLPGRRLWAGALVGGTGAEILKWASSSLVAATRNQPGFQAFGIALILLVWINYFSRLVVLAAAWAFVPPRTAALPSGP